MQGSQPAADHLKHLELVVQNTTNMVVVTNGDRQIEWVNPAYTRITGWTLDEVKGKTPGSFLHGPKTNLLAVRRLGAQLRNGQPVTDVEILNYKKSGEAYWVSLNIQPVADDSGEIRQYVAIESDITQRKQAELESARMLHQLAEAHRLAKLGLLEHDLGSGVARCSAELMRILDARRDEVEQTFDELIRYVHPDDTPKVRRAYERAINSGAPCDGEFRVLSRQRRLKWVHARGALEGWDDGRRALFRTVIQDITERKDAEQLARDKQLLEQAQRTQMEVLSRISHELRTPLHAVLGFAETLERGEGERLSMRAQGHLGHIRDSARHLLVLVNDILDLTRLHGGGVPFDIEPVEAAALADEVAAMVEPLAAARGVRIEIWLAGRDLHAAADRQRLRQVLINLVNNAIKYNRPGGLVRMEISSDNAGAVGVRVIDTGIGIAEAHLPRLFEPFFHAAGKRLASDSTGLGLAIARSLVRGMGGDIRAHSRLGEGSTFVLSLPRAELLPSALAIADVQPAPRQVSAGTVLYIEDNELNCAVIEGYLAERPSVQLLCSGTGGEGLALARQLRPTLMLIDMSLPDMSGIDVIQAVLDDPLLHRTPCIAFSADATEAAVEAAIRSGFRAHWPKPLSREDFLDALDRLFADGSLNTRY